MSPSQCRAARALLGWTQSDLAHAAKVSDITVRHFELGRTTPTRATIEVMQWALEAAGVELIGEQGVSLNTGKPKISKKKR